MVKFPPYETIAQTKKCSMTGEEFVVTQEDLALLDQFSPTFAGKKYAIPAPTFCPKERERRRLCWRNELGLHRGVCGLSGEPLISLYSSDKPYTVYSQKSWWSDDWSPFDYGRNFDFDRPFFEQFDDLLHCVPFASSVIFQCENCDYNNYIGDSKDCFMSIRIGATRDAYYCYYAINSDTCVDCTFITDCRECFDIVDCEGCYQTHHSQTCKNCNNVSYSKDCLGCSNCFLCVGLRNKEYCIQNQQYSPQDYESKIKQWSDDQARKTLRSMLDSIPHRENENLNCSNCIGNHIKHSEDLFHAFDSQGLKKGKYLMAGENGEHQYDTSYGHHGSFTYDTISVYHGNNAFFTFGAYHSSFIWYSFQVYNTQNAFGSAALKKGKNVILNKEYSQQEYETLAGKIIDHMTQTGEWGQYFPHEMSPFGYNESVAGTNYPLEKQDVQARGWKWHEEQQEAFTRTPYQPLEISQYDEAVVGSEQAKLNIDACLGGVLVCQQSNKPFRIVKKELAFYIQNRIELPKVSPEVRRTKRMQKRNEPVLYERKCDKCGVDILTTYAPSRPEKIYCEACYRKEIY